MFFLNKSTNGTFQNLNKFLKMQINTTVNINQYVKWISENKKGECRKLTRPQYSQLDPSNVARCMHVLCLCTSLYVQQWGLCNSVCLHFAQQLDGELLVTKVEQKSQEFSNKCRFWSKTCYDASLSSFRYAISCAYMASSNLIIINITIEEN